MISLEKRAETATTSLVKMMKTEAAKGNDLGDLTAQMILVMDYSGSMSSRYYNGEVQQIAERVLGLAMSGLDDDQAVPIFFFDHGVYDPVIATPANYVGLVDSWSAQHTMGGTDYLVAIKAVLKYCKHEGYLGRNKPPVLVLFVTDGETGNEGEIQRALVKASDEPVFWQFLGLGYTPAFLQKLDTMGGRKVDNVGLFEVNNTNAMSDEDFYDSIIAEFFPSWLPAARAAGITS